MLVPTSPASQFQPARADAISQLRCELATHRCDLTVLDITRAGVLLESTQAARIGSQLLCKFLMGDRIVYVPARVTHTRHTPSLGGHVTHQIGLAFQAARVEHARALDLLMNLLSALAAA